MQRADEPVEVLERPERRIDGEDSRSPRSRGTPCSDGSGSARPCSRPARARGRAARAARDGAAVAVGRLRSARPARSGRPRPGRRSRRPPTRAGRRRRRRTPAAALRPPQRRRRRARSGRRRRRVPESCRDTGARIPTRACPIRRLRALVRGARLRPRSTRSPAGASGPAVSSTTTSSPGDGFRGESARSCETPRRRARTKAARSASSARPGMTMSSRFDAPTPAVLAPRRGGRQRDRYQLSVTDPVLPIRWSRDLVVVAAVPGHRAVGVDHDVLVLHVRARRQARDVEPRWVASGRRNRPIAPEVVVRQFQSSASFPVT